MTFSKVLKKLEDFTLPAGDAVLEKGIAAIQAANKHLNAGDLKALGLVGHSIEPILRAILPAIPDKIVYAAIEGLANQFDAAVDRSLSSLAYADRLFQYVAYTMLSAMSKTTPTAETLN